MTGLVVCITVACGSTPPTVPIPPEPEPQVPARITIEPPSLMFDSVGITGMLTAVVYDEDDKPLSSAVVNWSSSDPTVARVTRGIVVAVGVGAAQVTAQFGDVSATAAIDVIQEISFIEIFPSAVSVPLSRPSYKIETFFYDRNRNIIPNAVVTWTSSDPAVATVDENGVVTPVARGSTLITVTDGNVTATLPFSVH